MANEAMPQAAAFESENGKYRWVLDELDSGILVLRPSGIATCEGADKLLEVLNEMSASRAQKLRLATISTELETVEPDAKDSARQLLRAEGPLERFATAGDNFFMRAFFKLYSVVAEIKMSAFATEEEAIEWLSRD